MRYAGASRILLMLFVFFATASQAVAATPRILLVGDSWAWYLWLDRSFQKVLKEEGLGEFEEQGLYTCVPGSTALQWTNPAWLNQVKTQLELNPTIDIVQLHLGGNDFLRVWRPGVSAEKWEALCRQVVDSIETVAKFITGVRENLRVVIVSYDYINETKGEPTPQGLNEAGMIIEGLKRDLAARLDRVEYIQTYGLMQYHFGAAPDLPPRSVPLPGQAPDFSPFPGGSRTHWNVKEAMLDDIHLTPAGYEVLARHCVNVYYRKWLTESKTAVPQAAGETESGN